MVRDCLSLPNLLSPKSPRENAHIINIIKFNHNQSFLPYSGEQIIEYHDVGGRPNTRLTTGQASRHLRGDLAQLMRALQSYLNDFMDDGGNYDYCVPSPMTYDYITEALIGHNPNPKEHKEHGFENMLYLETFKAIPQIYALYGK